MRLSLKVLTWTIGASVEYDREEESWVAGFYFSKEPKVSFSIEWSDDAEAFVCVNCHQVFEPIDPAGWLTEQDFALLSREHRCGNVDE